MKEPELGRMNFLKQGARGFTYKHMLIGLGVWVVFLVLCLFFLILREHHIKGGLAESRQGLQGLNDQQDKQIKLAVQAGQDQVAATSKGSLASIIMGRPVWSETLRVLARSLPSQVWLTTVETKQEPGQPLSFRILGKTGSQRALTNFIMALETSGFFKQTELIETKGAEEYDGASEFDVSTVPVMKKL